MLRWLGRLAVGTAAAMGALMASQFPEFAQQYRQRLGGALQEMHAVVSEFDATAADHDLTREQALERYDHSSEQFLREQGASVQNSIERYEDLSDQHSRLASAPGLMRPIVVLSHPDPRIVGGAWADYEPSVPVTSAGFIWAATGFFLAGGAVSLIKQLIAITRRGWRRSHPAQLRTAATASPK